MSFGSRNTTSSASSIIYTPRGDSNAIGELCLRDDPSDAVPWPGNTYIIRNKDSERALGSVTGLFTRKLSLSDDFQPYLWLCVESNGYFGFFNKYCNKYLSFQDDRIQTASDFGPREFFLLRRHPQGGYQLLVPASANMLKQVAILSGSDILVVRQHAGAIWEFTHRPEAK